MFSLDETRGYFQREMNQSMDAASFVVGAVRTVSDQSTQRPGEMPQFAWWNGRQRRVTAKSDEDFASRLAAS
jgi:hypothetical protein